MATLKIINQANGCHYVNVDIDCLLSQLKELIALQCGIPIEEQQLIHGGRFLVDEQKLSSYGIRDGHAIHLLQSRNPTLPTIESSPEDFHRGFVTIFAAIMYLRIMHPELFSDEED